MLTQFAIDKEAASAWARRFIGATDWVMLDTETTGLDGQAEIVEIAIAAPDKTAILSTRIKPSSPISESASNIHGIFDSDLELEPSFTEVYADIREAIAGKTVLIYNASFDLRMLRQTCDRYGLPQIIGETQRTECVMQAYAQWFGDWNQKRSSYRWQKLDGGDHTALGDCLAAIGLVEKMAAPQP